MDLKSVVLLLLIPYVICVNHLSLDKPAMDGLSVQIHWTHAKPGELEMMAEAGFKFVRMNLKWEDTEKKKGVYDFSDYEYLYDSLKKHNMSGYSHLAYDNPLHEPVSTDEGRAAYVKWASTAIQHFKGRGIIWEIWNEPNVARFWKGHFNQTAYCRLAIETINAVRKETTNEIVVGPATYDIKLTDECLQMGLNELWDGVSVHAYRPGHPETVVESYAVMRRNMERNEKSKKLPILCGEWGYSSGNKEGSTNETLQAKYLQRVVLNNILDGAVISNWYDWHDDGTVKTNPEHNYGVVHFEYNEKKTPVYEPKEAYHAVKTMTTQLKGFKFSKRIHTTDKEDYVLLFHKDNELHITAWSTKLETHEVHIPSDKCEFEVVGYKGSPVTKAESSGTSLVLKISDSVNFVTVKCSDNKALKDAPAFH